LASKKLRQPQPSYSAESSVPAEVGSDEELLALQHAVDDLLLEAVQLTFEGHSAFLERFLRPFDNNLQHKADEGRRKGGEHPPTRPETGQPDRPHGSYGQSGEEPAQLGSTCVCDNHHAQLHQLCISKRHQTFAGSNSGCLVFTWSASCGKLRLHSGHMPAPAR